MHISIDKTLVRACLFTKTSNLMLCSYFSGFRNKDVAFLHMPSKSLIEADLLMNLPANEQVEYLPHRSYVLR